MAFLLQGNSTLGDLARSIAPALADKLTNLKKRMIGQAEYVMNIALNYDAAIADHSRLLVIGERIVAAGVVGRHGP